MENKKVLRFKKRNAYGTVRYYAVSPLAKILLLIAKQKSFSEELFEIVELLSKFGFTIEVDFDKIVKSKKPIDLQRVDAIEEPIDELPGEIVEENNFWSRMDKKRY